MNPLFHTDFSISDSLKSVRKSVLIYETIIVRYNPQKFEKYMESKQNWLLHEFIEKALYQFIDEISCEITHQEIMSTGYRK